MSRLRIFIAAASAAVFALSPAGALCDGGDIKVLLDGRKLSFEVQPQIIGDRTMVPLRTIFEELGADVDWNGEKQTVTAKTDDTEIVMTIGSRIMTVNSRIITLDVPPQIVDDFTLVPVRAVSESFGADVDWDQDSYTVIIETADQSEQEVPEPTEVAEAEPTPTPQQDMYNISYNDEIEYTEGFMKDFKLTSVKKDENGDYIIDYTFKTFKEGRGNVTIVFNCLDENGNIVDTFGGGFVGSDYAWSMQEGESVISGKTVSIELSVEKSAAE